MDNNRKHLSIEELKKAKNIVPLLDSNTLMDISDQVLRGYKIDEDSRKEWFESIKDGLEIANLIMEEKEFPWEGASNVKYPLIATASIEYASRTFPEIIQDDRVVKVKIIGSDKDDAKYRRSHRVSTYMSYQLTGKYKEWVKGTDLLISMLPVVGIVFKKTYYNAVERKCVSEVIAPDKIVVNQGIQTLESARRITHVLTYYANDIIERQRSGLYTEKDLQGNEINLESLQELTGIQDPDAPITLLEQCCYLDLDGDGYKEPYVVTVEKNSGTVFRVVNRFDEIEKNKEGKVKRITPHHFYTDFHFIRSPDGGYYSIGFGILLLSLNHAINTIINQLIDSGTLYSLQSGFIGRGVRVKNGDLKLRMGQWKFLDTASGSSLKDNIFPLPTKEPSSTLYQLLGLLMQVGKDLSSTTDVTTGKQPAQNVASSTIAQLIDQGTKFFVAINKRLYSALEEEYRKIYYLNYKYLKQEDYAKVIDDPEADVKKDFALDDIDICPVADPSISSESQRITRAGAVQQLRTVDPREADRLLLEALHIDSNVIEKLLPEPDPNAPPPPEVEEIRAKTELLRAQVANLSAEATIAAQRAKIEFEKAQKANQEADARIAESQARVWKMTQDAIHNEKKLLIVGKKAKTEADLKAINMKHTLDKDQADIIIKSREIETKKEAEEKKTEEKKTKEVKSNDKSKSGD